MLVDTKHRSHTIEIMDDLEMTGDILIDALDQLATINKLLGGTQVTLDGLKKLLEGQSKEKTIRIIDLGCGSGDMLRKVAKYGIKNGYKFKLLGIDANQATVDYANKLSADFPEISYKKEDVLSEDFKTHTYEIAMCTLFLHHFDDNVAMNVIQTLLKNAKIGVLVNDLHRHRLAYYLFKIVTLGIKNDMTKSDGLVSILRAFKRRDFERYSKEIAFKSTITWHWAFRYQWIIKKL
ncbi:methyltransferase domain-containing protein [Bizionia argentinensis JUB59]|uniref:Methyltransferase domain-containing protein n=1 Tax=Bizionia argentinensis JUB59 TaxID=1046627 RepID=G2EFD6_9FLAO|nr:methyltransferase domain-containing protein [Bizionia argentinensis]EGV42862.1 methyltransferase domain-containing protein [Bizionia argentinensis JUB59]